MNDPMRTKQHAQINNLETHTQIETSWMSNVFCCCKASRIFIIKCSKPYLLLVQYFGTMFSMSLFPEVLLFLMSQQCLRED